jgi:predicted MFS family arabinose efflux permease
VRALLAVSVLFTVANELPFIAYGAWLAGSFNLSVSSVGLASIVVGLAEAVAELGTTQITDRLGKRRSILVGLLGLAASLAALPMLAGLGLAGALAGVALMMLTFEFGIVSLLPLATELAPEARASTMSLTMTAFSLGRIGGAIAGGWLWAQTQSIARSTAAGAVCALLAALVLVRTLPDIE